jgi:hypothetical protein
MQAMKYKSSNNIPVKTKLSTHVLNFTQKAICFTSTCFSFGILSPKLEPPTPNRLKYEFYKVYLFLPCSHCTCTVKFKEELILLLAF